MSSTERPPVRRRLVISGAGGGGIGTACAHALADSFDLVLNGSDRNGEALDRVRRELEHRTDVDVLVADIAEKDRFAAALESIGPVHGFVHNAAPSTPHVPVHTLDSHQWSADFRPIIGGAQTLLATCVPSMITAGWGRAIFISSSAAVRGTWGRSASYAAAKAALLGLTAQVALELGPHGITANAVAPSQVLTPRALRGGRRTVASLDERAGAIPLRRVGRPGDVAALVGFLCSDGGAYITGQTIRIDGGSALAPPSTQLKDDNA